MVEFMLMAITLVAGNVATWPAKGDTVFVSLALGSLVAPEWQERLPRADETLLKCDTKVYCTYRHPFCGALTVQSVADLQVARSPWEGDLEACALQAKDPAGRGICFRFRGEWELVVYADEQSCSDVMAKAIADSLTKAFVKGRKGGIPFKAALDDYGVHRISAAPPD